MSYPHAFASFVAVDTETTGLDFEHDRMIELAAVRFENGKPVADFEALLAPGKALSPVSRLITGLTAEELEAAPPAVDTLRAFLDFVGDLPLVAHNAEFDAHFVKRSLEAESLGTVPGPWVDSLLMSRIAWPTWDSHRLDSLAERLQIPREAEHRALPDARRAGFVFIAAQDHLVATLSDSARAALARLASDLPDWGRVFTAARNPAGVTARSSAESTTEPRPTALSLGASAEVAAAADEALANEGWLALETPPEIDDAQAALEAALRAAARGQRVLVCLPDNYAWNALRKSAAVASATRVVALAEPSGYLCRARLAALVEDPSRIAQLAPEERAALMPLVAWADRAEPTRESLLADGRGFSPERSRLTALRIHCDSYADDPGAQAARSAAQTAGVILVTQATLGAHLRLGGSLLPACDSLIVAGAHRLPEGAQRAFGREVTLFRLRYLLQLSAHFADTAQPDAHDAWFEPEKRFQKFLQKAGRAAGKKRPAGDYRVRYAEPLLEAFEADPAPVVEALLENESVLEKRLPDPEARRALNLSQAFRKDFAELGEAADAEQVYTFEDITNPHKAAFRSAPLGLQGFGERLRELFGAGLFLSPALLTGPNGDAEWLGRNLGLGAVEGDHEESSLRAHRVRGSIAPPRFVMAPFAPGFSATEPAETFARFLADTAQPFADKGVFVFFPSQSALRSVHHALKSVLPEGTPCWAQHVDGNRDAVYRLYATGVGGWVLATEGLPSLRDSAGNGPDLVLITRMPLPPAHDPILEARGEILKAEGRNARAELWHPAAVLRFKKEWASLNRFATAEGEGSKGPSTVWLLDARASSEGLGALAGRSIGANPQTARNPEELAAPN